MSSDGVLVYRRVGILGMCLSVEEADFASQEILDNLARLHRKKISNSHFGQGPEALAAGGVYEEVMEEAWVTELVTIT